MRESGENSNQLMNKVEELYSKIESLENQNSRAVVRANSQSSNLQRQLELRNEQIELGRNVLENSRNLITRMQSQLENKDNQLQAVINQFSTQLTNANNQIEQRLQEIRSLADRFNNLQVEHANLRVENAINETRAEFIGQHLERTENQLETRETQLEVAGQMLLVSERENARNEARAEIFEQQLERRENQLEVVTGLMGNLQLENAQNENDLRSIIQLQESELREKGQKIRELEREVNVLREQLGQSQGERLTNELRSEQEKLERLAHRLMINWEQIQILRDTYEQLVRSRRNNDQAGTRTSWEIIEEIKQNLLQQRVHIDDVQQICRFCEEIAEIRLRTEQNQRQEFTAHTQVPLRRY